MKIILRQPRAGKTTELIERCNKNGGYIVCPDARCAREINRMAKEMNMKIEYPLTFSEFLSKRYYRKGVKKFYIDNADKLIRTLAAGIEVDSIVMDKLDC